MRLQTFGISAFVSFVLGASVLYCSPAATVPSDTEAGVCDPDSGTNCPCNPNTYKPSDCYHGPLGTNGKGACKAGKKSCSPAGVMSDCVGEVLPSPEVCDYADNDCNGVSDDLPEFTDAAPIAYCESPACDPTFRDAGIYCFTGDLGICGAGRRTCAPGASAGTPTGCKSFIKNGVPEECNAIDDDCNGQVDDGLQGTLGACDTDAAVGQCAHSNVDCKDGGLVCPPSDPGTESCDGKDNDCNGIIDDKACPTVGSDYCCKSKSSSYAFCTSSPYYLDGGGVAYYDCKFSK
ncbi:MAG TPA: MopE-related protein [Polyangiaceae bacterium]